MVLEATLTTEEPGTHKVEQALPTRITQRLFDVLQSLANEKKELEYSWEDEDIAPLLNISTLQKIRMHAAQAEEEDIFFDGDTRRSDVLIFSETEAQDDRATTSFEFEESISQLVFEHGEARVVEFLIDLAEKIAHHTRNTTETYVDSQWVGENLPSLEDLAQQVRQSASLSINAQVQVIDAIFHKIFEEPNAEFGERVESFLDNFQPSITQQHKIGLLKVFRAAVNGEYTESIIKRFELPEQFHEYIELPKALESVTKSAHIETLSELVAFASKKQAQQLEQMVWRQSERVINLSPEFIELAKESCFSLDEAQTLFAYGMQVAEIADLNDVTGEQAWRILAKHHADWQQDKRWQKKFVEAAKIFGYPEMLSFTGRKKQLPPNYELTVESDISRKEAIHGFDEVIVVQKMSGLSPGRFYRNILKPVVLDRADYFVSGNSYQYLRKMIRPFERLYAEVVTLNERNGNDPRISDSEMFLQLSQFWVDGIRQDAAQYDDLPQLQEELKDFATPAQIFESWTKLQEFNTILSFLEQLKQGKSGLTGEEQSNDRAEVAAWSAAHSELSELIERLFKRLRRDDEVEGRIAQRLISWLSEIDMAVTNFLDDAFLKNSMIPDLDKQAAIDGMGGRMPSMFEVAIRLTARYIATLAQGKAGNLQEVLDSEIDNLYSVLRSALEEYKQVYTVDIPMYDKLYRKLDSERDSGRELTEVFLGRDGIYSYAGRRAQDIARRRRMGLTARLEARRNGGLLEIKPQYVVFPRHFRDNLDYQLKKELLQQRGFNSARDIVFTDTGYTGSIPEQILRLMGYSYKEIDQHILLITSSRQQRQLEGIAPYNRDDVIYKIEHRAKAEKQATGLIRDEQGRLHHVAKPTTADEQLIYAFVEQALIRHYWIAESYGQHNDSLWVVATGMYTARVHTIIKDGLPEEFFENPGHYVAQHGELLKGRNEAGHEFPDEEIVRLPLMDGTPVIVKRVERRKTDDSLIEFKVLRSAQRAGLKTARPLGLVSAQQPDQPSYLLMDVVPGVSGRNFDRYLHSLGTFSESQQQEILAVVHQHLAKIAQEYRSVLGIDKRWRIKDTIIQLDHETGVVLDVIPLDWERARSFDPYNPQKVDISL